MKGFVYDCEIIRRIPIPGQPNNPKYEYCEGWHDFPNMGISVIAVMDIETDAMNTFTEDEFGDFPDLWEGLPPPEQIVGFNSKQFHDNLLVEYGLAEEGITTLDLAKEVRKAVYGHDDWESQPATDSYSLAALCGANGQHYMPSKAMSAKMWQDGKRDEVISKCVNNVTAIRNLLIKFLNGDLIDPNTGKRLKYQG